MYILKLDDFYGTVSKLQCSKSHLHVDLLSRSLDTLEN